MNYNFDYPLQKDLRPEFLTKKDAGKIYSVIGFGLFALTVLFNGLAVGAQRIAYIFYPELYKTEWFLTLLSVVLLYFVAVPVFALIIYKLPKFPPKKNKFSAGSFVKIFTVCYALTYAGALISLIFTSAFRFISGKEMSNPTESIGEGSLWMNLLFVVLLAPVLEELVFRKLLCNRLLFLGERDAVMISALAFGLMHGNFQQVVYATLIGIVLGTVYIRTGKLKIVIAYHMIINFMGSIAAPFFARRISAETFDGSKIDDILISAVSMIYSMFIIAVVITGIVFLIKEIRKFRFRENGLNISGRYSALIANPGIILALIAFSAQFILQIIYS